MTTAALDISGLVKRYGRTNAVDGLDLLLPAGTLACLIGPNGAGKSTTLRTVAGLHVADEGRVVVGGADVTDDAAAAKKAVGLAPQDVALFDHLTGEETLRLVAHLRGLAPDITEARLSHWLTITELEAARGRLVREYSGGMKRKLSVASAMLSEPPLVLLDESFTGLDPESTHALQLELRAYCDRGGAVLWSTHLLDMVHAIADRVYVVANGRCVDDLDRAALEAAIPAEFPSLTELYLERVGKRPATAS